MGTELKLAIKTEQLSADELALILSNLDKSFKAFVTRRGGRSLKAKLTVSAVQSGSIEVLIDAVDSLGKLVQARQYLAPFATHLAVLIKLALNMQLLKQDNETIATDRKVIKSLVTPVAKGHASQINIVNNGSIVFEIKGPEDAKAVLEQLSSPKRQNIKDDTSVLRHLGITERQVSDLLLGELTGSVFQVDGTWYARLLNGHGVLVPITATIEISAKLCDGALYTFRGRPLQGARGETIGITIDEARKTRDNPLDS